MQELTRLRIRLIVGSSGSRAHSATQSSASWREVIGSGASLSVLSMKRFMLPLAALRRAKEAGALLAAILRAKEGEP